MDSSGAGVNGALLSLEGSDWNNRNTTGNCAFWSAANFGSIRIVNGASGGTCIYAQAYSVFIDEPTEGPERVEFLESGALFVNGKSKFSNTAEFQTRINMPFNKTNILTVGGNTPQSSTSMLIQNGDEQYLSIGIQGTFVPFFSPQLSLDSLQGDVVFRGDEDHNIYFQTGVGRAGLKINTDNDVSVRKRLTVLGQDSTESPALIVGRISNSDLKTCILLLNDFDQDLTLGVAGANEDYSTSSLKGDAVIKSFPTKSLIFQSGNGASKLKIGGDNNVFITDARLTNPNIGNAVGTGLDIQKNLDEATVLSISNYNNGTAAKTVLKMNNDVSTFEIFFNSDLNPFFGGPSSANIINNGGDILIKNSTDVSVLLGLTRLAVVAPEGITCMSEDTIPCEFLFGNNTNDNKNYGYLLNSFIATGSDANEFSVGLASSALRFKGTGGWALQGTNTTTPCTVTGAVTQFGNFTVSNVGGSGNLQILGLMASQSVQTDASKNLVSLENTGTGNNVLANNPTLTTLTTTSSVGITCLTTGSTNTSYFGNNLSDPKNYGYLLYNYTSSASTTNEFSLGLSSSLIRFRGDGSWALQAASTTVACSITGAVTQFGNFTISNVGGSGTLKILSLTASTLLYANSSKDLVSIASGVPGTVLTTNLSGIPAWTVPSAGK